MQVREYSLELWEMQVGEYSTRAVGDASQRIFY